MKNFRSLILSCFLVVLPNSIAISKPYNGSCNMVAIRNTVDIDGEHRRSKGEVSMMVAGKERLPDGTIVVSEYRCCRFKFKDFRYIDDCRLP